jgi:hypothetical protein
MGMIYEVHYQDGLRWNDIHTKFHKDWFWHSGNIRVSISIAISISIYLSIPLILNGPIDDQWIWN